MNYIVLDLEWNQGNASRELQDPVMPFEIIEIGAVRMDGGRRIVGDFERRVRPSRYHSMHFVTGKLLHIRAEDLAQEEFFPGVFEEFMEWCGEDPVFCTWGPSDLTELQRNMKYHGLGALSDGPLPFFDVQKLYALRAGHPKNRCALETAVKELSLPLSGEFHHAHDDALFTAQILQRIPEELLARISYDCFCIPEKEGREVYVHFDDYDKLISRRFKERQYLLADREVMDCRCYVCGRPLRRRAVPWFTPNGRHYYCVANCPEHGYTKLKVRVRKAEDGGVYAVKTMRQISEEEKNSLRSREEKSRAAALHKSKEKGTLR